MLILSWIAAYLLSKDFSTFLEQSEKKLLLHVNKKTRMMFYGYIVVFLIGLFAFFHERFAETFQFHL